MHGPLNVKFKVSIYIFFQNYFPLKFLNYSFHSSFRGFSTPQYNMYVFNTHGALVLLGSSPAPFNFQNP